MVPPSLLTEMRGAAMSLTAAASGLVVFLLSVSVVQGQYWGVTYSSTEICAVKGSSLEISCSYTYPSRSKGGVNTVEKTFWFTKQKDGELVDLTTVSEYAGRVEDLCENNICILRIRNLTESDSAEYKFRFKTNQDKYIGQPGVTLSVRDLQVQMSRSLSSTRLQCLSSCPPGQTSYIWSKNRQEVKEETSPYADFRYDSADSYSCALKGYEDFPSPSVYGPKPPSVSVSPSAEIEEGSSVTLTCSSDANPAANYTWYKYTKKVFQGAKGSYNFPSISSEDRGIYYCKSVNQYGENESSSLSVDVQYAPKLPSVSVSPSAEIEEGSSVTLTCSSDANPAANYTWYKEDEDSPKASGQIFNITDFRAEHSGSYSCGAQNKLGRSNSTLHLSVVADRCFSGSWKLPAAVSIPVVLLALISLSVFLWIRNKRASRDSPELEQSPGNREEPLPDQGQPEQQDDLQYASVHFSNNRAEPLYSNMRAAQPLRHTEQKEATEYAAVNFKSRAPRTRAEDPAELYSVITKIH